MLKVGLTGGIGSGKSTVATLFQALGIEVIDADKISKEITVPGQPAFQSMIAHFGKEILDDTLQIDRKKLRQRVFSNPAERKWLEKLLHPLISKVIQERARQVKLPYCIIVIPLLKEIVLSRSLVDRVLAVDTPVEVQLFRTQQRDQLKKTEAQMILDIQASRQERLSMANDMIINDEGENKLRMQVKRLHEFYLELARQNNTSFS